MRIWGKWLTWGGLSALFFLVTGGIILAVNGFSAADRAKQHGMYMTGIYGDGAHLTMAAGQKISLYVASTADDLPYCELSGPVTPDRARNSGGTIQFAGSRYRAFETYRFPVAGDYRLKCDSMTLAGAPPDGALDRGAAGVMIAVFGGGLSVVALITGIVLWAVGANNSTPRPPMPPYGPPLPPAPVYGTRPPWQP